MVTPKNSKNSGLKPMINKPISAALTAKQPSNKEHGKSIWKPSRRQSMNKIQQKTSIDTVKNNDTPSTKLINNNLASLLAIKQKFMPKEEVKVLPWEEYKTITSNSIHSYFCQQKEQQLTSRNSAFDEMIQELNVSHARVVVADFETLSFVEADKLEKKCQQLKKVLETLYEKIKVYVDTSRAIVKTLKLNIPQQSTDEIFQLKEYISETAYLLEEFYFTSKYSSHLESKYLQHLAGTLHKSSSYKDICHQQRNNNNNLVALSNIFNRLRTIIDMHYNKEELASYLSSPPHSSPTISLLSSSSTSTASSTSTLTSSLSATTSLKVSSLEDSDNVITSDNMIQKIDEIIEKIAHQFKQKDDLIQTFEIQSKSLDTQAELAKQRERSAALVLQLEQNRSQRRLMVDKKQSELVSLKEQLKHEMLQRKSLQERVTNLENEIKAKDKLNHNFSVEIKDLKNQTIEDQVKANCLQNELRNKHQKELQTIQAKNVDSKRKLPQLEKEEKEWLDAKKSLVDQCSNIVGSNNEDKSIKEIVEYPIDQCKEDKTLSNKWQHEFERVEKLLLEKQDLLDRLKVEKESLLQDQNSALKQCYAAMGCNNDNYRDTVLSTDDDSIATVVKQLIQSLKVEYQHSEQVVDRNSILLKQTQQELSHLKCKFHQTIKAYTTRESAYILQSASTEAELERILKEYDRLTRNIIDFNNERKKFEQEIRNLNFEKVQLSKQLADEQIIKIQQQGNDNNSVLRREFRDLMATVKERHKQELVKQIDLRRELEQKLREKRSEIEIERWEKVDTGVQTSYFLQLPYLS